MSTDKVGNRKDGSSYTQIACIGSGLSGVALGATLKRWYNFDDIRFFDRNAGSGGTWWANGYPGCACDIPSALYSFSFHLNPNWTQTMPPSEEIKAYNESVLEKYSLGEKMVFSTEVTHCEWNEETSLWTMHLQNLQTGEKYTHKCQILFNAGGLLSVPRKCDIPGSEKFNGHIFHSAQWDAFVSLKDKNVIVIGNGCTGAQIVPAILPEVKHLTHIIRSKHWIYPAANPPYPPFLRWIFQNIPLALRLHRIHLFLLIERSLTLFKMSKKGTLMRQERQVKSERFMRKHAPAKYHDLLIPDFDFGCKRRIFDVGGYLKSLNAENITLTDEKPLEILPDGIRTKNGVIKADVIVLATGFETKFLHSMDVIGRDGQSVRERWDKYPGPTAYNSSVLSGFPNFFMLLGPNSATGYTSALIASENTINYALRILKPILTGKATSVDIKQQAEKSYADKVQAALKETVFNAGGCQSWYIQKSKWNATIYPWSQAGTIGTLPKRRSNKKLMSVGLNSGNQGSPPGGKEKL
ncbi:monooxygenase [Paracoccidioides lutzii Pb01]|uniref:Monooxygenase n=1 Tax=Paracoccidioides lutzii (strain ATCC MYA-826 / Pb01) TaxID=502779 RepID=C1H5K4_PARBA|nr:monooxygenase [Paracoccidioides lutzii Pb01]EEH34998.2 monooxygenase [Paracoccidioides lutzii Pb01]